VGGRQKAFNANFPMVSKLICTEVFLVVTPQLNTDKIATHFEAKDLFKKAHIYRTQ
jgi:hypothetical protein